MSVITEISTFLQQGKAGVVKELVAKALQEGLTAEEILNDGLLAGMGVIGVKFKNNEVYVPEVLIAARAMNAGMEILKPVLVSSDAAPKGKVILGTVKGDLHDIGKNLVKIMLEGKGLQVVDLGTDVAPQAFVDAAIKENANIIACSALLTTTMIVMKDVVKEAEAKGIKGKVKIMIGGAPVTQNYCETIGADYYTADAASAGEVAYSICQG